MTKLQPIVLAGDRNALALRTACGASRGANGIGALLHNQWLIA
jgi:hypothetical protein